MTLANQAFPSDALQNPWVEHVLPAWRDGNIARNLGTILGVQGIVALLPLFAALLLLALCWYWIVRSGSATPSMHKTTGSEYVATKSRN